MASQARTLSRESEETGSASLLTQDEDEEGTSEDEGPPVPKSFKSLLEELPAWVVPRSVQKFAKEHEDTASLRNFAGRALPLAYGVAIIEWSILPTFMILTRMTSQCADSDSGQATYDWWSWFMLLPVQLGIWMAELQCLRTIILPKWAVLKDFKLLCVPIPFYLWLVIMMVMSALHTTDLGADSAFVGTTWRGMSCPGAEKVTKLWDEAHAQSSHLFFMEGRLGVLGFTIFTWGLNYVASLWALVSTMPVGIGWDRVSYDLVNPDAKPSTEYATIWSTIWAAISLTDPRDCRQNHGAALMTMAESGGMAMVVDKDMDYAVLRAEVEYAKLKTRHGKEALDQIDKVSEQVLSQAKMTVLSVVMGALLANCWQLYTRIMLLAIHGSFPDSRKWIGQTRFGIMVPAITLTLRVVAASIVWVRCMGWERVLQKKLLKAQRELERELEDAHGERPSKTMSIITIVSPMVFITRRRNCCRLLMPAMVFLGGSLIIFLLILGICLMKYWCIEYCYKGGYSGIWLLSLWMKTGTGCLPMPQELLPKDNATMTTLLG